MTTVNTNLNGTDAGSIFDPNTTDPDKLKMQADAMLFVSDLQVNQVLKQQWTSLLANIKSKIDANPPAGSDKETVYKEKIKIINNFLAQKGYETTSVYVLELTRTDFYEDHVKESEPMRSPTVSSRTSWRRPRFWPAGRMRCKRQRIPIRRRRINSWLSTAIHVPRSRSTLLLRRCGM